jgi:hypothetical protein
MTIHAGFVSEPTIEIDVPAPSPELLPEPAPKVPAEPEPVLVPA